MEKSKLRNQLFNKYFEIKEGIPAIDLLEKLSFIKETWKKLHQLCQDNIKHFDIYSTLDSCKVIEHNKKKYFIIKRRCWNYVIIDIEKKENITEEQFKARFNEDFFVKNFDEPKDEDKDLFELLYNISIYTGDIEELLKFYIENQKVLDLSTEIYTEFKIDNAITCFCINLANARASMRFQTPDQYLYENLFLNYDLTPWGFQDAGEKIGIEKMNDMFEQIRNIKIPVEYIPKDLYEQYVNMVNDNEKSCIKKYKI